MEDLIEIFGKSLSNKTDICSQNNGKAFTQSRIGEVIGMQAYQQWRYFSNH